LLGAGLILVAAVLAVTLFRSDDSGGETSGGGAPAGEPVVLSGVGAYDPPPGDGSEHDAEAANATDGSEATYWTTESYQSSFAALGKPGVGLVLDAGRSAAVSELVVTTDTPGYTASIMAGDSSGGPFEEVSGEQTVDASTTFDVDGAEARYFVVWITNLGEGAKAHVNEAAAT
jgi:hypothetical protein